MPLCAYFVSGKCSYGNKCHNTHIDVHQMVQTEMKAAIQGKQWPLSCFSPFKDEPSLPDLIDDQSFEEVRLNFYLAKVENRLPQFQEEIKRLTGSAYDKMSKLMMSDPSVKNYLVDIFGINGKRSRQVKSGGTFANTFGSGDTGGGKSIFDRISSNHSTEAPSFGAPSASFGGGTSIFGGQSSFGASAGTQKSIFGQQSVFAAQPQQTQQQSIFAPSQPTNSFFKLSQLGAPQAASGGNLFTQSSFGPPTAPAATFPATTASSVFGGGGGGFRNTQPMSTESIFGGGGSGSFGQQNQSFAQQPSQFGQSVLAPASFAPPAQQSVFGQTMQQPQDTGFGQMMMQQQPNVQQPMQNLQQNTFAQPSMQPPPQSVFGSVEPQQQPQPPSMSSVFANPSPFAQGAPQGAPRMNPPAFAPPPQPPAAQPAHLYSKIDELTPDVLESFKADSFVIGKIPTVPPPVELCGL